MDESAFPRRPSRISVPTLKVVLLGHNATRLVEVFLVDSGADLSMASRQLCDDLQLDWSAGEPITLAGISPKAECAVSARILNVEMLIPELGVALTVPVCFAEGDSSQLLGREGFFDSFRVTFDKQKLETTFEAQFPR